MDPATAAERLVEAITAAVHQRFNRRTKVLVPPRLTGSCKVDGLAAGEKVMDRADVLLESSTEDWPEELDAEVYMDLLQEDGQWRVAWVVDTTGDAGADELD